MLIPSKVERAMRIEMLRNAVADLADKVQELAHLIDDVDGSDAWSANIQASLNAHDLSSLGLSDPSSRFAERAAEQLRMQNARAKFFPKTILRDYGWNILLDLFLSHEQGKRVSVSSACLSSDGPATTALRWLHVLEKEGLIARDADPDDGRRIYVAVTPLAHEQIRKWLRYTK